MNHTFFEQFLVFTEIRTGLFIALLVALFLLQGYLKKKEILSISMRLFVNQHGKWMRI